MSETDKLMKKIAELEKVVAGFADERSLLRQKIIRIEQERDRARRELGRLIDVLWNALND